MRLLGKPTLTAVYGTIRTVVQEGEGRETFLRPDYVVSLENLLNSLKSSVLYEPLYGFAVIEAIRFEH